MPWWKGSLVQHSPFSFYAVSVGDLLKESDLIVMFLPAAVPLFRDAVLNRHPVILDDCLGKTVDGNQLEVNCTTSESYMAYIS